MNIFPKMINFITIQVLVTSILSTKPLSCLEPSNQNSHEYWFFTNKIIEDSKLIVFPYSLPAEVIFQFRMFITVSLDKNVNSSIPFHSKLRFSQPFHLVIAHEKYFQEITELGSLSKVYNIFYNEIFSERAIFFWLLNVENCRNFIYNTFFNMKLIFVESLLPAAPSLSFHAKIVLLNAKPNNLIVAITLLSQMFEIRSKTFNGITTAEPSKLMCSFDLILLFIFNNFPMILTPVFDSCFLNQSTLIIAVLNLWFLSQFLFYTILL